MKSLKLAVAHMTISADVSANASKIRELMRVAAADQVRLVQFPEGSLSGYCKQQISTWNNFNWPAVRVELESIFALARHLQIWVVLGSAHRLSGNNLPHNSLYIISDNGKLENRYDKRRISNAELNGWYTPGNRPVIIEVDGIKLGMALCIEIQFPELFDEYRRLGAEAVLLSAYAGAASKFDLLARAYAELDCMWIGLSAPANALGDEGPMPSSIIGPDSELMATTVAGRAGLAIGMVSPDDPKWDIPIHKARPWRELAREGGIYRKRMIDDSRSTDTTNY